MEQLSSPHLLYVFHLVRMAAPLSLLFSGLTVKLGILIKATLSDRFLLLNHQRMRLGVGILTDCGDLPGDLYMGCIGRNFELAIADFFGNPGMGVAAYGGQLVAKVGVLDLEPAGQLDRGQAEFVSDYVS